MSDHNPPGRRSGDVPPSPPPRRLSAWSIVGGVILGVIASWFTIAVTLLALYDTSGGRETALDWVVIAAGFLAVPVLAGASLLSPRTRRWGAGLLIGIAIGAMAGAGACASFWRVGSM